MSLVELKHYERPKEGCAICLGTFDGVHLGHQALIGATLEAAKKNNLLSCAYTFDIPPAFAFSDSPCEQCILTDIREKAALMEGYGIRCVIYSHFDSEIAQMSSESFFKNILVDRLNARCIVIGFHYRFGHYAQGTAEEMKRLCASEGILLHVIPPVRTGNGTLVSSSAIRNDLQSGDRKSAELMLNRSLSPREEQLLGGKVHET